MAVRLKIQSKNINDAHMLCLVLFKGEKFCKSSGFSSRFNICVKWYFRIFEACKSRVWGKAQLFRSISIFSLIFCLILLCCHHDFARKMLNLDINPDNGSEIHDFSPLINTRKFKDGSCVHSFSAQFRALRFIFKSEPLATSRNNGSSVLFHWTPRVSHFCQIIFSVHQRGVFDQCQWHFGADNGLWRQDRSN